VARWHRALLYTDVEDVITAAADLIERSKRLDAANRQVGLSSATTRQLQLALGEYLKELDAIGAGLAADAQQAMREQFKRTRRRDHSGIKARNDTLLPNLVARPVRIAGRTLATVGIGDVDRMDRVINPLMRTAAGQRPYWRAQEYGSRHLVGRQMRGMFYDTGGVNPTRPGAGPTRQPIFLTSAAIRAWGADPGTGASGGRAVMRVRNPIRPKHFIAAGEHAIRGDWNARITAAENNFMRAIRPVMPQLRRRP
jgi:hypothetical protein